MTIGIIPARFGSTRFPGKPLANILGKSLIQRTYENAKKCTSLDLVVIATDDNRIFEHAKEFGAEVFMTKKECPTGTDRVAEVVEKNFKDAKIIVNIQGDEPCLNAEIIDRLIETLKENEAAVLTTPVAKITDPSGIFNPATVKCVFDQFGKALYFSRAPVPFPQNSKKIHDYYRHLGVYCYQRDFLIKYCGLGSSRLQNIEDLEQLKILENGFPIHVCIVDDEGFGIDTPEDLKKLEELLCRENIFLSPEALSRP